jgi:hypothetical protein
MRTFFEKGRMIIAALFGMMILASCMKEEIVNPVDDTLIDTRTTTATGVSTVIGLNSANELYTITATVPAKVTAITPILDVKAGERIIAIDVRPATQQLYGLGSAGYLYTIDRVSGLARAVGQSPITLNGSQFGFDFNPRTDRIRIVSDKGQNISVNPITATVVTVDGSLNSTVGINSIAYLNAGATTSTTAPLYDISGVDFKLYTQNEKTGWVTGIGSTGLIINGEGGFDIARSGAAFAILTARSADGSTGGTVGTYYDDLSQEASRLFAINLRTGKATNYGKVGNGIIGIAIL